MSKNPISPVKFDVLIIYSDLITKSASTRSVKRIKPFNESNDNLNDVYAYLLTKCEEIGLRAGFSTTNDITGSGSCRSYWLYRQNTWVKVNRPCYSQLIFDKFFPRNSFKKLEREQMFLSSDVKSFTSNKLMEIFFDKFQTYLTLTKYSVPTVTVDGSNRKSIREAILKLQETVAVHLKNKDFGKEIIMKDRFGSGGNYIYKITSNFTSKIYGLMKDSKNVSFILQPLVAFDNGYRYKDYKGATEIRLIYKGRKVIQTYIRVAKGGDFVCNFGGGGIWISEKDVPKKVKRISSSIAKSLNKKHAIFALDFIVSDNDNVYLLEANVSPGINWYEDSVQNKKMNQKMIGLIAEELSRRVVKDRIEQTDHSIFLK